MSGGVGWRKRSEWPRGFSDFPHIYILITCSLVHSRPGAAKLNQEDRALPDTDTDSLRPPSERSNWRNTFHSRPGTPSRAPTPTIFHVDTDDVRRDITLDVPNPRKATKPKLARYLSGYLAVKDVSKEPEFSVPWLEIPPASREYVDPMASLQSVFSHMTTNPSCPIPLHYNNGIFRVFEDYRKVRDEKERLDDLLHETFEGYRAVERFFEKAEAEYQAEIRRLELLIARGTSGMDGVIKARRDSTVRRMIAHKKTASEDSALVSLENTPTAQLDDQIRIRSQQGLLHRPVSPSSKMAMLSRRLENTQSTSDFIVGTPPIQERKVTLSRKLQSELDLARLADPGINGSVPRSVDSGFSGNGDPLPDEVDPQLTMVGPAIDLEAFVALKELGSLVARKRGIDTNRFLTGLMQLFSMGSEHGQYELRHGGFDEEINTSSFDAVNNPVEAPTTPEHIVRHVRSQPLLWSAQRSRRHFSFEPGDDQLAALERELKAHGMDGSSNSNEVDAASGGQALPSQNSVSHNADTQKPPRIPSPMQWPGLKTVRRGSSNSSIRTTLQNPDTRERRSSRSSVLTAFRQESNGSSRPVAQSRSSSVNALRHVEAYSSGSAGGLGARCNFATVAAVRAVEQADNLVSKTIAAQSASIAPASGSSA
ncbi:uncharacterized protein CC84DRAFT_365135 [Paraphaeosphaeria sporulosa]|uniref:Uncharacterized protein n=1 Tax=Paraphaeosphaeria sporulosa TaxID=1460663 RepID=A0A177BWP6_9PLEO|nr:uncharacterized protein CC84DRAFT_365135 [Paraphaeosphaeria sporulosa]OAF99555.1 hypothetical protein CC84DRAFT_365135 [Paraphaeosphaeria sporulosa]